MKATDAAAYLGVSASKLRGAGIPHKVWGGNVVYDRTDLDALADSLPYAEKKGSECDEAFGIQCG